MNTTRSTGCDEWTHPLFVSAANNADTMKDLKFCVNQFMYWLGKEADRLAKANAEWHDDPTGDPDGFKQFHAPALEQFPPKIRQAVACELFEYVVTQAGGLS